MRKAERSKSALDILLDSLRPHNLAVWPSAMAERLGFTVHYAALMDCDAQVRFRDRKIFIVEDEIGRRYPDGFTARQRFSLAHELAHVVLLRWPHTVPSGERNMEKTCDFLAGEILIPARSIEHSGSNPLSSEDIMEIFLATAESAWVSRRAAAIRLTGILRGVQIAEFRVDSVAEEATLVWSAGVPSKRPFEAAKINGFKMATRQIGLNSQARSEVRLVVRKFD